MRFFLVFAIFLLDQYTKHLADHYAPCFLTSFLSIVHVKNYGIIFGMLQSARGFTFYLLSSVTLGIALYVLIKWWQTSNKWEMVGFSCVLGGAAGNLLDRFLRGYVLDFLDFHLFNFHYPWAFNIADAAIMLGIGLLLLSQKKLISLN